MAEGKYAKISSVLSYLSLCGDESKYNNTSKRQQERSYSTRISYEIVDALEDTAVDAVEVTRCKDCGWALDNPYMKEPMCICPEKPKHRIVPDGYCNFAKPKGGGNHG